MTGILKPAFDSIGDPEGPAVVHPPEQGERFLHIILRVEGRDRRKPLLPMLLGDKLRVALLNVGAVPEHHLAQALCGVGTVYRTPEALLYQSGQVSAMVDVGM